MSPIFRDQNPFSSIPYPTTGICNLPCPSSPSPSASPLPSLSPLPSVFCGVKPKSEYKAQLSLGFPVATMGDCWECSDTGVAGSAVAGSAGSGFLGGSVVGFTSKLGLGGSESSVTIELAVTQDSASNECSDNILCGGVLLSESGYESEQDCKDAGNAITYVLSSCVPKIICSSPSPSPSVSPSSVPGCGNPTSYSGRLGEIYTFQIGGFVFRGILTNHQYAEGPGGYRYTVTLTDGRSLLDNITVILNNFYLRIPQALKPNLINALFELEKSIEEDWCGSGKRCGDFMKSGASARDPMYIKDALRAINNKPCQVPISGYCLLIDTSALISVVSPAARCEPNQMTVLKLIVLACEQSGYDFFIRIVGNNIVVVPVDRISPIPPSELFKFLKSFNNTGVVSSRDYGQEMTFSKTKKMVSGNNYHYLVRVDSSYDNIPRTTPDPAYGNCDPYPYKCYDRINKKNMPKGPNSNGINPHANREACEGSGGLYNSDVVWVGPSPMPTTLPKTFLPGAYRYNPYTYSLLDDPYTHPSPNISPFVTLHIPIYASVPCPTASLFPVRQ